MTWSTVAQFSANLVVGPTGGGRSSRGRLHLLLARPEVGNLSSESANHALAFERTVCPHNVSQSQL
jgi:hypothetical protein